MSVNFHGRVVLVTGSGQGLGRELVLGFARAGADVVVNYLGSDATAHETAAAAVGLGRRAIAIHADVSLPSDVDAMIATAKRQLGRIDVLVNNAAISRDAPVWKLSERDWDAVLDPSLKGVFLCTKAVLPQMREHGYGRVLNISSVVALMGVFGTSAYAAAKAGISGFARSVAKEVVNKGITVNTLSLGYIDIGMCHAIPEELRSKILTQIPMGRFGTHEEVLDAALFLASERAGYITGQELRINGGLYM